MTRLNLRFTRERFWKKRKVKNQEPLIIVVKTGLCTPSRSSWETRPTAGASGTELGRATPELPLFTARPGWPMPSFLPITNWCCSAPDWPLTPASTSPGENLSCSSSTSTGKPYQRESYTRLPSANLTFISGRPSLILMKWRIIRGLSTAMRWEYFSSVVHHSINQCAGQPWCWNICSKSIHQTAGDSREVNIRTDDVKLVWTLKQSSVSSSVQFPRTTGSWRRPRDESAARWVPRRSTWRSLTVTRWSGGLTPPRPGWPSLDFPPQLSRWDWFVKELWGQGWTSLL